MAAGREEINRINVFPVPDGDTGTNFSLTLRAVADALRALGDAPLPDTARTMARAAVLGARGNSGMMLAHFLLGFAESLGEPTHRDARASGPRRSGPGRTGCTNRSTIRARAPSSPSRASRRGRGARRPPRPTDIGEFMRRLLDGGRGGPGPHARADGRPQGSRASWMPAARGSSGCSRAWSATSRAIRSCRSPTTNGSDAPAVLVPAALVEVAAERDFQFCTEVLVRGEQLPAGQRGPRARMHAFGGSVVVAVTGDILKIHVHTDTPEAVFTYAARWGRVETTKADDMRAQHRRLAHPDRRPVAVVTDSSADLADSVLDRHHIALVPLQVVFGDETFRDRVELKPEEFYRRLRSRAGAADDLAAGAGRVRPGAAGCAGGGRRGRRRCCSRSALSGTYASAQAAVRAGGHLGRPSGGQPVGLARGRAAGAAGGRAGRGGVGRARTSPASSSGCGASRGCC